MVQMIMNGGFNAKGGKRYFIKSTAMLVYDEVKRCVQTQ
jgi:hypothetical protein